MTLRCLILCPLLFAACGAPTKPAAPAPKAAMASTADTINPPAASPAPASLDTAAAIYQIRSTYATINNTLPTFVKKSKDLFGRSTEGTGAEIWEDSLHGYRKIVATDYGETGKAYEEYYVHHDTLFFAYIKTIRYDRPIYVPGGGQKIKETTEDREYFAGNQLILWLTNGKKADPSDYPAEQKDTQGSYQDLLTRKEDED